MMLTGGKRRDAGWYVFQLVVLSGAELLELALERPRFMLTHLTTVTLR